MKEGYLQLKISELNDKCKKLDQLLTMEKSKIELLEERVGGLKELIKKLKNLDEFKDEILKQIKKNNQDIFSKEIISVSDKIEKNINNLVKVKIKDIENIADHSKSREREIKQHNEMILEIDEKLNYLLNHNNLLMMKLVNKGVISDREVNELHTRSSKKSKN